MDYTYLLILRLVHVVGGIFWGGAIMYLAAFVLPAVKKAGPEGGKFMQVLSSTNKLPLVLNLNATVTIIAGILLMWRLSNGFTPEWMGSRYGIALSFGGLTALIAYGIGHAVNLPSVRKMAKLGRAIAEAGGPPTEQQLQELAGLRKRIGVGTVLIAWMLIITSVTMAIARYL